ncbi:MAG: phenylacetic acid degradation protein PaaN [Alphaproteobacteria bacterium]|nr:phenylacetic acid degradation protein PaaN [Alphaproteobacteria bacterium]
MSAWFTEHEARLERAVRAREERGYWSPFPESPSRKLHPEGARERGLAAFEGRLGQPFELGLPGALGQVGEEVSPYTLEPLGVQYPAVDVERLMAAVTRAAPAWAEADPRERVGICMEWLHRLSQQAFEHAHATTHTTGQPFLMAFAGSGANALDRGLEALAAAWAAMRSVPAEAVFERSFGRGAPVRLEKRYRLRPRGVAVVVCCGSYPAWNAWPAVTANLATGNPVVLKPHPECVLPVAIAVETGRALLAESGFSPDLLTLAADTRAAPVTQRLLQHADTAIVDFTGSQGFGRWIERSARHAQVYTETSGCNAAILESTEDLDATLRALAHGLSLFSGQMCTTAQNVFVPRRGVRSGGRLVSAAEVEERLVAAIDALLEAPAHAAAVCGAVASPRTLEAIEALRVELGAQAEVLRDSAPYAHPDFPQARTATPLLAKVSPEARALYGREHFGPMAFVIEVEDAAEALALATRDARERGAIASYVWSTDAAFREAAEQGFFRAGASVAFNLRRQLPINFAAAFSDFHVTGLNPAGSACLTDPAFVARRFGVVQSKIEVDDVG